MSTSTRSAVAALAVILSVAGCSDKESYQLMSQAPRYDPLEASDFFRDGQSARKPVDGTVARGYLGGDPLSVRGEVDGQPSAVFPFPVTRAALARGRDRFDIYCSPCHGQSGYGDGMVVRRGFTRPPSLHDERLREAPAGHFFRVMTQGFGAMPEYAKQVSVADRWAIAAYVRALQLSQHARLADVPPEHRGELGAEERAR